MLSRRVKRMIRTTLWSVISLCMFMVPVGVALWWSFPRIDFVPFKHGAPPPSWAHQRARAHAAEQNGTSQRVRVHYVPSSAIASDLKLAVLVGEDASFFSHGPVDFDAMQEALEQWWAGRRLRGASTITQQLAKNLFLNSERSVWRKVQEVRLAWWLERKLSKNRIFELYLNIVELGPGIYGVDAASRYYFDVTAAELNQEQAVNLAATIPGPLRANPRTRTRGWMYRRSIIEEKVGRLPYLRTVLDQQAKRDLRVEDP